MARSVTLAQMRTRVRQRSNMEQSQFVTDVEIDDNLNESLSELYDLLVASRGQEYYRSAATGTTVSGTISYSLPADFYQLISLDIALDNQTYITARPYMEYERNRYRVWPGWNYATPVYYRLQANKITFIPAPSGAYTYSINYVPACTKLYADTDTFDGVSGWEEYAVVDAAIKCLQKEESDVSVLMAQKAALMQRIEGLAGDRDANEPERVHDVTVMDWIYPWL